MAATQSTAQSGATTEETPSSFLIPHSSFLIALLRLGLVAALVGAIGWSALAGRAQQQARQGIRLLQTEQYNAAQAALQAGLNIGPLGSLDGPARLYLSYAYLARRSLANAGAVLEPPLTSADPTLAARAWVQQGRIAAWGGQTTAAVAAWREALRLAPAAGAEAGRARRAAQWHLAEIAWQTGQGDAAAQFAALAAAPAPPHDPYGTSAALRLAQIRSSTAPQPDQAALTAARATGSPDATQGDAPYLHLPGLAEGLPPETWAEQRAVLDTTAADLSGQPALAPASAAAVWGRMWVQAGEWRVAARTLRAATTADPTLADAYAYLGLAEQRLGDPAQAALALGTAVHLAPDRPLGHHLLARFYLAQGAVPAAQAELDWLQVNGGNALVTMLDQGALDQLQGNYDAAEAAYLAAEGLAPAQDPTGDPAATLNPALLLAQFYQGYAFWACERGRPAADRALAQHAGPDEYDAVGWTAHLCHDEAAARAPLEQATRLAPRDPRLWYHLGAVYRALGQPDRARAAFLRASDYDPGGPWERRATNSAQ
jgi:tetratricopeptide (TPR) repeat protein